MWRIIILGLAPQILHAESLVAARTLPARSLIGPDDVVLVEALHAGAFRDPALAVGMETRSAIYAGRPVGPDEIAPPALVDRNALVTLVYQTPGLSILAEGRALARGRQGEEVRVLNLASRNTVTGRVLADGRVLVGGPE